MEPLRQSTCIYEIKRFCTIDSGLNNSYFHSKGGSLNYLLFWTFQTDTPIIKVQMMTALNKSGIPVGENREKECPGL